MDLSPALRSAISLYLMPTQSQAIKSASLPEGIVDVLSIAAGDALLVKKIALATDRTENFIKQAAQFFIEHILLAEDSDSYRILGASPEATRSELRKNMALITRFLHPDLDENNDHAIYISRFTSAWNNLKTTEKRAAYDCQQAIMAAKPAQKHRNRTISRKKHYNGRLRRNNYIVSAPPQYKVRRIRGVVMRHLTLLLMKISGH